MMTIIVDTREKLPYRFAGIHSKVRRAQVVDEPAFLVQFGYLATGDYSVVGLTDRVAVERKNIADLYGTLGRGRDRFHDELERLAQLDVAAVVIEATLGDILRRPPAYSRMCPSAVANTIVSWSRRWPRVHWWFADTRRLGEILTFRLLEGFWRDVQRQDT